MSSFHQEPLAWYFCKMSELSDLILKLCECDTGLAYEEISKAVENGKHEIVSCLNDLLKCNELELLQCNQTVKYRAKSLISKDLLDDEKVVLSVVEGSGSSGMWIRDVKNKSGLHQTVLNKCIKQLEVKSLIRQVKSAKHPTRKMYIAFSAIFSDEAALSSWYTDNEIDAELVSEVLSLLKKIFEQSANQKLDAEHILKYLKSTNILTSSISLVEVEEILSVMAFENFIAEILEEGKKKYTLIQNSLSYECGIAFS